LIRLFKIWNQFDIDSSGKVDIGEFKLFGQRSGQPKMAEKLTPVLLGKKIFFTLTDIMRIIWPCAEQKDVSLMKSWIHEYDSTLKRVDTPPILPNEEMEALRENFKFFDKDRSGSVSYGELSAKLIDCGLFDKETAQRYMDEWDLDGDGVLSEREFCEMLCHAGYRAHEDSRTCTDSEGYRLIWESGVGWHRLPEPSGKSSSKVQYMDRRGSADDC